MASTDIVETATVDDIYDDLEPLPASLENVLDQTSLRWIFVGGKGGVGKTTTSCCLGIMLSKVRRNVLIVSTDPAHNLSDAFGQKFGKDPIKVNGFDNLSCMEVDASLEIPEELQLSAEQGTGSGDSGGFGKITSVLKDIGANIPGIDEAMGFATVLKHVQELEYECIVFDTAPTGHTLRLLSFPRMIDSAINKIMSLRQSLGGIFNMVSNMMGGGLPNQQFLLERVEQMRETIALVNKQFKDPGLTTFVCVCIPEFLSLFETERLVQQLTKFEIDTHNIVVNQVLYPDRTVDCGLCKARQLMQQKYLDQIADLYEDFHVVKMPLLKEEVRGVESLQAFATNLVEPYSPSA